MERISTKDTGVRNRRMMSALTLTLALARMGAGIGGQTIPDGRKPVRMSFQSFCAAISLIMQFSWSCAELTLI